jgi:hypothetical protein
MSTDDKLDILKEMIALVGGAVLRGEQLALLQMLCARFDEAAARPKAASKRSSQKIEPDEPLPDVYEAYASQAREEFLAWSAALGLPTLKRLVKTQQFDAAGRSRSWKKAEKFAELIYEQLQSRTSRGDGFRRVGGS